MKKEAAMGTLNSTPGKHEIRNTTPSGDFFTNPLVDKVLAVMACIPIVYPLIQYYRRFEFNVSNVTWLLDVIVILSTMLFRRTAVRVTRNPWLWLLTCLATYWFLMIGLVEQNGRPLAPLWVTNSLAISSTIVELWGRFSLGRNIGFVPAQREVVTRGAYRYVRHPIYTGLFIWIVGYWLSAYSPRNTLLYALGIFWFAIKSVVEERFLRTDPAYAAYMERVRWRWIPIPCLARLNSRAARTRI
jgi:protein-S-isoprenylcysteine O-methyltransferase Ste14